MTNEELAAIFTRIANLLEIKGEVIYKTLAYRRAAENLTNLPEPAEKMAREGRLGEIPGVGKAIAEKISELLDSGTLRFLQELEGEVPPTLIDLLQVPDVGPKKVALFWKQAGITTLAELEDAALQGKLSHLPGMGDKSEKRIVQGIAALSRRSTRMTLGTALPIGRRWLEWLRGLDAVQQAELGGSLRRRRSTIGDLDLLAASTRPDEVMDAFTGHPDVQRVLARGTSKSSVELSGGVNIQLWVQPPDRFGTLLQFVTGSKDHNVRLRELAQQRGLSLSEQWLRDESGVERVFAAETDVYAALGLPFIPPELREDRGEVAAALAGALPALVQPADLRAELHSHSIWSDGAASIAAMADAAIQRGLRVLAVTDHTASLGVASGLTVERLREQRAEIEAVRRDLGDRLILLHGAEVEIRADGSLDFPDDVLAWLDIVVASLHVSLRQPREVITPRLLGVMRNPHVDIIGHPTGRLLPNREGADLDMDAVLDAARRHGLALEINANPHRLDLDEIYARRAAEMGIPLALDTDAHSPDGLDVIEYGLGAARRAWLEPSHILNGWSEEKLLAWLRARGAAA